jgi:hypothetical protein
VLSVPYIAGKRLHLVEDFCQEARRPEPLSGVKN